MNIPDSPDNPLHASNREARNVALAAKAYRSYARRRYQNPEVLGILERRLDRALSAYEEVDRRAQQEATG